MGAKSATTGAGGKTNARISSLKPKSPAKPGKSASDKVVRDSFTMPTKEYAKIAKVKNACLKAGFQIKKSELLRIGIALISDMGTEKLKSAQAKLDPIKTGRPKKQG
jgi:hypothetical protein